jgi:hypothetical protein
MATTLPGARKPASLSPRARVSSRERERTLIREFSLRIKGADEILKLLYQRYKGIVRFFRKGNVDYSFTCRHMLNLEFNRRLNRPVYQFQDGIAGIKTPVINGDILPDNVFYFKYFHTPAFVLL